MTLENSSFDRSVDRTAVILLILCTLATCLFYSIRSGASIAVGGVLSLINFHWLKRAVDFVILEGGTGPVGKRVALQYMGRYALIALTLYVTIRFRLLVPALIVAGLLVYVLAILLVSVFEIGKAWKNISS
jgi:hypothetical protein